MTKNQVYSVKIYFIEPVEIISVLIDTLIRMEFETYVVRELDRGKLLKVLGKNVRSVVFLSIIKEKDIKKHIDYVEKLNRIKDNTVQVGAFVHKTIKEASRNLLLERQCSAIQFADIKASPLKVIKKVLLYFEARGTRSHIRTKPTGLSEAYFTIKNLENPLKAVILDISSQAFLCRVQQENIAFFDPGSYMHDVLLVLKGMRLRTSAKILGFHKEHPNIFIMKFCTAKMVDNKFSYEETITPEIKKKLHNYIKICLKDNLANKLDKIEE